MAARIPRNQTRVNAHGVRVPVRPHMRSAPTADKQTIAREMKTKHSVAFQKLAKT